MIVILFGFWLAFFASIVFAVYGAPKTMGAFPLAHATFFKKNSKQGGPYR